MKARITAIVAIAVLVGICLIKGINSAILASALGLIGALGGLEIWQARHPPKG